MSPNKRRPRFNDVVGSMTPDEFKRIRKSVLRLTQPEMATVLGLGGKSGEDDREKKRSIYRYEHGETSIPGPIVALMKCYAAGFRPPFWPAILAPEETPAAETPPEEPSNSAEKIPSKRKPLVRG